MLWSAIHSYSIIIALANGFGNTFEFDLKKSFHLMNVGIHFVFEL